MYNLYETIAALCNQQGISPAKMCSEIGISRGNITELKMGRIKSISTTNLQKIANYFNVSTDYLLGKDADIEEAPALTEKDQRDIAKDLELIRKKMESGQDLMFDGVPMNQEDIASILSAMQVGMEMIRRSNKTKYTPKKLKKD